MQLEAFLYVTNTSHTHTHSNARGHKAHRWRSEVLFTAVEESGGHGSEHDWDLNMGISFGLGCLDEVIEL